MVQSFFTLSANHVSNFKRHQNCVDSENLSCLYGSELAEWASMLAHKLMSILVVVNASLSVLHKKRLHIHWNQFQIFLNGTVFRWTIYFYFETLQEGHQYFTKSALISSHKSMQYSQMLHNFLDRIFYRNMMLIIDNW